MQIRHSDQVPDVLDWYELGTGLTEILLQTFGELELFIGATVPNVNDEGMIFRSRTPLHLNNLNAFGGGVWVRWSQATGGSVRYVSA